MRLVGVMLACAAVLAAQTVEGTVVNPLTKAGVADADVRLLGKGDNNYAALTDAQGYFRFDNVLDGSYSLDCGKEGFDGAFACQPTLSQLLTRAAPIRAATVRERSSRNARVS